MGRMVLLRHETPEGGHHFDLMLQRCAGDERLLTFRLDRRIGVGRTGRARGELLGEHRAAYLTYEGGVSGGRGFVRREWSAEAELAEETDEIVRIRVGGGGFIELRREREGWSVQVTASESEQCSAGREGLGGAMIGGAERG